MEIRLSTTKDIPKIFKVYGQAVAYQLQLKEMFGKALKLL